MEITKGVKVIEKIGQEVKTLSDNMEKDGEENDKKK